MKKIIQHSIWSISSFLKNKNYNFDKNKIFSNLPDSFIDEAIKSISSWETYSPTPLLKLNKLNEELKFQEIYYKDEDKRFDLKSFKALGGAFAVYKIASEKKDITVSTATAGNHGRSVAWGAQRLGIKCKIFISENVSESRAEAMRNLNAEVIRVHGNYDNSLKECIKQSEENNWEIVQDVSWDGYKEVPKLIMAGYTIMIKEIIDQVDTNSITHVFLQAGVGGMAAGAARNGRIARSTSFLAWLSVRGRRSRRLIAGIRTRTVMRSERSTPLRSGLSRRFAASSCGSTPRRSERSQWRIS